MGAADAERSPELTEQQEAAVTHPLSPVVIVAGAGSGKTEVMARRILHLLASGAARPDQVIGLTFSNKAAINLQARVKRTLGPDSDVNVTTYHGFGAQLVDEHRLELGLSARIELLDRPRAWQLLLDVFDEFEFVKRKTGNAGGIVDYALALAGQCADHLVTPAELRADCVHILAGGYAVKTTATAANRLELVPIIERYESRKRELGFIDHNDQISLPLELIRAHPSIAIELRDRFPIILLDEYQDTNVAQRRLLQAIYGPGSAVTAVGDDVQSIYAFRGAAVANLIDFERHFPPAVERKLEVNFRSGPEIVALANRVQDRVGQARPKELRVPDGVAASAIGCFLAADDDEEAATIAASIAGRIAAGERPSEIAVLCRKRKLTAAIVSALQVRSVPIDVVGLGGLLARPEIVDVRAWLEVVTRPSSVVATLRLLLGPRYRTSVRDLAAIARHGRTGGRTNDTPRPDERPRSAFVGRDALLMGLDAIDSAQDLSGEAWARVKAFAAAKDRLTALAHRRSLVALIETIATDASLWGAGGDGRVTENISRFIELAQRFVPVGRPVTVGSFLEYLEMAEESSDVWAEAVISDADAVRIMTIHQAKGLEFDHVYVPGLAGKGASSIFPDSRMADNPVGNSSVLGWWLREDKGGVDGPPVRLADEKRIEATARERRRDEELRLLYVAVTRARRTLTVSAAHWYGGIGEAQGPTEFYDFIAAQNDLVTELFRHEPAVVDPGVAAKERLAAEAAARRTPAASGTAAGPTRRRGSIDPRAQMSLLAESSFGVAGNAAAALPVPRSLSVSSVVSYVRCPKQFFWNAVQPLPRRPTAAASLGTRIHRWIEAQADPQLALSEFGGPSAIAVAPIVAAIATAVAPGGPLTAALRSPAEAAGGLRAAFLSTPYAELSPSRVETAFLLASGGRIIRGRIDATYERDGRTELVDWKTGRAPDENDPSASTQLELYALAAIGQWGVSAETVRTTYAYLRPDGSHRLVSDDWTEPRAVQARAVLARVATGLDGRRFDPHPGPWCQRCDFQVTCPAGSTIVSFRL